MGGVDVDEVTPAEQVAALDDLDAHQPGEKRVLKVGGVVHAGSEDDDEGVDHAVRGGVSQRIQQPRRVLVDLVDALLGEEGGEGPRHGQPVLEHVADARGDAHVVLKDPEGALLVADQVDARDVHPDAVGRIDAGGLAAELLAGEDHGPGDHAVVECPPGAVDVFEERLEGQHALSYPA